MTYNQPDIIEVIGIIHYIAVLSIDCPNAILQILAYEFPLRELTVINSSKLFSNAINIPLNQLNTLITGIGNFLFNND